MQRLILSIAAVPVLAAIATAQSPCFEQNFGVLAPLSTGSAGYGDDVTFDLAPMNISFPLGGISPSYTHASISDNGIMYLTTGGPSNGATGAGNGYQNLGYLVGQPGDDPRIAPFFGDLWSDAVNGGGVWINDSLPGKFVVTWENMVEWWSTTQAGQPAIFTFQAQLFDTGEVVFYYGPNCANLPNPAQIAVRCGVSEGNGVVDPGSMDLTISQTQLASFCVYEEFLTGTPFDLADNAVNFLNAGAGFVTVSGPCTPANNTSYGEGCYNISDSIFELMDPVAMDLTGLVITGISNGGAPGTGYVVTVGPGVGNLTPGPTAVALVGLGDDAEMAAGTLGLSVGSNGWVATAAGNSLAFTPSVATFLNQPNDQVSGWTDLQPNAAGSGQVFYDETGSLATVTYDGVYGWGTTDLNFIQITYDTTSGNFSIEFGATGLTNPENFLVGYSPPGPSTQVAPVDLSATAAAIVSTVNVDSLSLTASGSPISTSTTSSTVTYTTSNMIEFGGGVFIGLNIISTIQSNPGVPLAFLGAPGCQAYVGSLAFTQAMAGTSSTQSVTFPIPVNVPSGFEIFSQSINLVQPNSLPNGQNTFGLTTSNGIRSFISSF
ncbi:MAG: hypothetical protein ACI89X_004408 [Planctomycetota bacterium]|jgi:hypothetical protein